MRKFSPIEIGGHGRNTSSCWIWIRRGRSYGVYEVQSKYHLLFCKWQLLSAKLGAIEIY
jgi:hypothetical protein